MWPQAPSVVSFLTTAFLDQGFSALMPLPSCSLRLECLWGSLSSLPQPANSSFKKIECLLLKASSWRLQPSLQTRVIPATTDLWNIWGQGPNLSPAPSIVLGTWQTLSKYLLTEWRNYIYILSYKTNKIIMTSEQLTIIIVIVNNCCMFQILS